MCWYQTGVGGSEVHSQVETGEWTVWVSTSRW